MSGSSPRSFAVRITVPAIALAIDAQLVQLATDGGRRWQLSHWDALVIEAARQAGCTRVLTEDLSAGAVYHGLQIENPF